MIKPITKLMVHECIARSKNGLSRRSIKDELNINYHVIEKAIAELVTEGRIKIVPNHKYTLIKLKEVDGK